MVGAGDGSAEEVCDRTCVRIRSSEGDAPLSAGCFRFLFRYWPEEEPTLGRVIVGDLEDYFDHESRQFFRGYLIFYVLVPLDECLYDVIILWWISELSWDAGYVHWTVIGIYIQ